MPPGRCFFRNRAAEQMRSTRKCFKTRVDLIDMFRDKTTFLYQNIPLWVKEKLFDIAKTLCLIVSG